MPRRLSQASPDADLARPGQPSARSPGAARIALVDDEESAHYVVGLIFNELAPRWLLQSHRQPAPALEQITRHPPDAVILDLRMPQLSGLKWLRKLNALAPRLPVVMFTASMAVSDLWLALFARALGYLVKPVAPEDLVLAVRQALLRESYLCPWAATHLVRGLHQFGLLPGLTVHLSAREQEVVALLFQGLFYKEIATKLGLGEATVHTHAARLLKKLGLHGREDLLARFLGSDGAAPSPLHPSRM